jgi:hypothetical protein
MYFNRLIKLFSWSGINAGFFFPFILHICTQRTFALHKGSTTEFRAFWRWYTLEAPKFTHLWFPLWNRIMKIPLFFIRIVHFMKMSIKRRGGWVLQHSKYPTNTEDDRLFRFLSTLTPILEIVLFLNCLECSPKNFAC